MGNCLVKKLQQTVEDENLCGLNEFVVEFLSDTENSARLQNNILIDFEIISGNKNFELTHNGGNQPYFKLEGPCKIKFKDKDKVHIIHFDDNKELSLDFFKYFNNLYYLGCKLNGILDNVKLNPDLKIFGIENNSTVNGDITKFIRNNPQIKNIILNSNSNIYGNLDDIIDILRENPINFAEVNKDFNNININISSSVIDEYYFQKNNNISTKMVNIQGDISLLHTNFLTQQRRNTLNDIKAIATWENERPTSMNILALENVYLGNYVDAMLINQAKLELSDDIKILQQGADLNNAPIKYKWRLDIFGTRTSASDEAVQILKSKNVLITINNVNLYEL